MLLSCLVFVTDHNHFDRSWQLNFFFFVVDHICTISHVVVLSSFCLSQHLVQSIKEIQYRFRCRSHLYNRSHCYHVLFSSKMTPSSVGTNSLILVLTQTKPIQSVTSLFLLVFVTDRVPSNQSQLLSFVFSVDHICMISHIVVLFGLHQSGHPIQSTTSLFYLVFITDYTQSNRS